MEGPVLHLAVQVQKYSKFRYGSATVPLIAHCLFDTSHGVDLKSEGIVPGLRRSRNIKARD